MCGEDADDKGGERQKNRGAARKTGKDLRAIMVEFAQILCNLRSKLPQGEERDRCCPRAPSAAPPSRLKFYSLTPLESLESHSRLEPQV